MGPAVLVFTPWFRPHLGGVETTVELLAREFSAAGCDVTVLTTFPSAVPENAAPFRIVRWRTLADAWRAVRAADIVVSFGPSLRFLWLPLVQRKTIVINHFTWVGWTPRPLVTALQRLVSRCAHNVAPSEDLAQHVQGTVLPNPFDDTIFRDYPDVARDADLVFLGRLTRDKGLGVLLEALRLLHDAGEARTLTVIGTGQDRAALQARAQELGVAAQVRWRGPMSGEPLARELSRHRTLVVPSLCREAFGIVAIEGLACGCELVCSDHGGLPEAAGGLGVTFPAGDAQALAAALRRSREAGAPARAARETHLARYRAVAAARRHLDLLREWRAA